MQGKQLKKIEKIIKDANVLVGDALLTMRFECGLVIQDALVKGYAKSVNGAASEIASYISKKFGKEYSQQYWRDCYLMATRLNADERALMLRKHISITNVKAIVNKPEQDLPKIIKAVRQGKFQGFARTQSNRRKKPANTSRVLDLENLNEDKVFNIFRAVLGEASKPHVDVTPDEAKEQFQAAWQSLGL